ncbi:hypothetical protein FKW77_005690 [Venturia effusa]|uniref:Uncharacterized protein n=1 Tax=Venturia effusa TaxID=50376 RepID=A0A517LLI4_9PEZI|nr:hypothetical protein FKW77_005690 [Venturia effusa]
MLSGDAVEGRAFMSYRHQLYRIDLSRKISATSKRLTPGFMATAHMDAANSSVLQMDSHSFEEERLLNSNDEQLDQPRKLSKPMIFLLVANVTLLFASAISFSFLAKGIMKLKEPSPECFDENLLEPPIIWQQTTFNTSVDIAKGFATDWFDPTSPEVSADWFSKLNVGHISISDEEAIHLPKETAHDEHGYIGVLEVFHQLHCLTQAMRIDDRKFQNRIRQRFYNLNTTHHQKESAHLTASHDKHCFNYLWQTLMCHVDVSVMSLEWNEGLEDYIADFAVVRQCRNFEVVKAWAKEREV